MHVSAWSRSVNVGTRPSSNLSLRIGRSILDLTSSGIGCLAYDQWNGSGKPANLRDPLVAVLDLQARRDKHGQTDEVGGGPRHGTAHRELVC